jgi:hypothetical protein
MTDKDTINSLYFSYFEPPINQKDKRPDEIYNIGETFTDIRSGAFKSITDNYREANSKEERSLLKQTKFPFVTFSGIFSTRAVAGIVSRSGFLCIDLDHLGAGLKEIWDDILIHITPALMFISPSGDGIKVILRIDINGDHLAYFLAFQRFFKEHLDVDIDKACKDVSRACFLCHDPNAVMSENPTLFDQSFIDSMKELPASEPLPNTSQFTTIEGENEAYWESVDSATPLEIAAFMIRGARDGEKHTILLKASRLLGGYVASNLITREDAVRVLEFEIRKKDIVSFPDAQKTIQDGLNYGSSDPLKNSPPQSQGPGEQARKSLSSQQEPEPEAEQKHKPGPGKQGKAPFDQSEEVFIVLSPFEFARDIFKFKIQFDMKKKKHIVLDGLYRDGVIKLLANKGYCKKFHENNTYDFIREQDNILDIVEPCIMKDHLFNKIREDYNDTLCFEYDGVKAKIEETKLHEKFLLHSHLLFNDTFLEHLPTHTKPLLRDTPTESYFPFLNRVVKVTADDIIEMGYAELSGVCLWRKHILKRVYTRIDYQNCHFEDFISNISNHNEDRVKSIVSAIGYLLHNFSHPSKGQAVIAYDEEITDLKNPMGGTGKGIIQQAIAQLRTVVKIDGKKFDEKDKFSFQDIDERTQVVFFDDVKAELGFDRFNSILTEGWNIEPKRKPSFFIPPKDSPKVYITSNAIIQGGGTTAQRRQFIIELAPFYSKLIRQRLEPIRHTHGCAFFGEEWDNNEWNAFYTYMLDCVQLYLKHGLKYCKPVGLGANKLRQATSQDFYEWVTEQNFITEKQYDLGDLFSEFKMTYYGEGSDFYRRTFTNWLKTYALTTYLEMKSIRSNSKTYIRFQCTSAQETI